MEDIKILKDVFNNYLVEDESKYIISSKDNIPKLMNIFNIRNNNNYENNFNINIDKISFILKFIEKSFEKYRINIDIFNSYFSSNYNNNIYFTLIDFYLYNKYNNSVLDDNVLELIDLLISNIDISKIIIDYILQKYSHYFYAIDENINKNLPEKYEYFYKLLKILIHIFGINHKNMNPKCFYYLTEESHITIPIFGNNTSIGVTLWLKYYFLYNDGEILAINLDKNNTIKLNFEDNTFIISYNETVFKINEIIKDKSFLLNDYNCITFNYKSIYNKWLINFYLNKNKILEDFCIRDTKEKDIFVYFVNIGKKFVGEISSIIINNNKNNFNEETQKKLYSAFPYGFTHYKYIKQFYDNFKEIVPGIINLYSAFAGKYHLINNTKNDLILENKDILSNNIHIYKSYYRKIYLLGGIKIILPIMELFYTNIEIFYKYKDLIILYLDLISLILKNNKKNMLDAMDNNFFMMLSIFIEKMPNDLFNPFLFDKFIDLGTIIFNENKYNSLFQDYFNYILLNENIYNKFSDDIQLKLWKIVYNFFEKSHIIIYPLNKIANILLNYDKNYLKEKEICCEEHYNCFIDVYKNIYKDRKINNLGFKAKTEKLFLLYEGILRYTKEKENKDRIKYLIEMLALNISPCFIIKILILLKKIFTDNINQNNNMLKKEIFKIINNNEKYKILIFNSLSHEFIDVKYYSLTLILAIYNYNPKEFIISFDFIKNNILPSKRLNTYNFKNYSNRSKDISIIAKHCANKINNLNTFNIYNRDDFICSSIFNFSFIYLYYIKIVNLFLSYINNNQDNIYKFLDILIHISSNMNIEITIELINSINAYCISDDLLAKNIFIFIPLINYLLNTLLYYINSNNSVFEFILDFFSNMISYIKDNKKRLTILEYIMKFFSIIKNRGESDKNINIELNNSINNIISKLLNNISETYINKNEMNNDYKFLVNLISIIFNYFIIFNQDKLLYNIYLSNKNFELLFSSYENEFALLSFFEKGLNLETNGNKENNKLKNIWKDFSIVQNIYNLVNENFNIYINNESYKVIKDKINFLFNNFIINKEILDNNKIINIKKIFYYIDDINKSYSFAKIIQIFYEIGIFLCKETQEFESLINQYTNFILFIIIISIRILPENINIKTENKLNDNNLNIINQDILFFSVIFLYDTLCLNSLINNNNYLKKKIINHLNGIIYLCSLIYETGITHKNGIKISLKHSPPFQFFEYYFVKDENEEKEKNNLNYLNLYKDHMDKLYSIISEDIFKQGRFYIYGKFYKNKYSQRYIKPEILMNCAKSRLENDTMDIERKYSVNKNKINENLKEKTNSIKKQIKQKIKNKLINSYDALRKRIICYKSLKKKLFMFNGPWSNLDLFYNDKSSLKYKILNHNTKCFMKPFLYPIIDLEYYMPKFSKFDSSKLFNNSELEKPKYKKIDLDIDKILNPNYNQNEFFENFSYIDNLETKKNYDKYYICCLVKSTHHIKGLFKLKEQNVIFKVDKNINKNETEEEFYDVDKKSCFGSYFREYPKDKDILNIKLPFNEISYIFKRLYYYNDTGLEIFTIANKNYYFNFRSKEYRNLVYKELFSKLDNQINKKSLENIIHDWKEYSISNMELLMWLNIYSGRSYNDISQYPVLPWIISNYNIKEIEEKIFSEIDLDSKDNLYRDLNLPLGMISINGDETRKKNFIKNFIYTTQKSLKKRKMTHDNFSLSEKPYNYGTHYSNPFYVTSFLVRIFPFSFISIELQGNKFDDPDRLFISVEKSFNNSITQKGDIRELIPEFYAIPEIYYNINNLNMGIRRNKEKVNNVNCPIWSGDNPYKFLTIINIAFESNFVSSNINNWIDLIYGYKQRGKEAEKENNIYTFPSYGDLVPIDKMNKDEKIYFYRLVEFGICPRQIFKKPFDKREKPKILKEIINANNQIITIDINEDKKIKTDKKKIIGIFPIEKEGIKILFNDFTGIDFIKEKVKENSNKYAKIRFLYGHGLMLKDILFGNSKIDIEHYPFALYNNGQFLIEGGFINGEMTISDLINNKVYLLFNKNDHSPVNNIQINKEETIGIVGNLLGIIYIYNIKEYSWDYKIKLNFHSKKINDIFISSELNAFVSCSEDNYINIFSIPSFKVINSFLVQKPEIALLSSRPLPACIIYNNENKKLIVFGVNGKLIKELELNNKPESCIIYTNKLFRDYLIFSDNGKIFKYSLPYLENINEIKLFKENLYYEYELILKYYKNKRKNIDNIIACDIKRQLLYLIENK